MLARFYGMVIARAARDGTRTVRSHMLSNAGIVAMSFFVGIARGQTGKKDWPALVNGVVSALVVIGAVTVVIYLWHLIWAPVRLAHERGFFLVRGQSRTYSVVPATDLHGPIPIAARPPTTGSTARDSRDTIQAALSSLILEAQEIRRACNALTLPERTMAAHRADEWAAKAEDYVRENVPSHSGLFTFGVRAFPIEQAAAMLNFRIEELRQILREL